MAKITGAELVRRKDGALRLGSNLLAEPSLAASLSPDQLAYADAGIRAIRAAQLLTDDNAKALVADLVLRADVKGRGTHEHVVDVELTVDELYNSARDYALALAVQGLLPDPGNPDADAEDGPTAYWGEHANDVLQVLLEHLKLSRERQAKRASMPSGRLESLPPREQKIMGKWREGSWHGPKPQLTGRVLTQRDLQRLEYQYDQARESEHVGRRDMARFARELAAASEQMRQRQRGIEIRKGPYGAVSVGPKPSGKRGRKRGGRRGGKKKR